MALNKKLPNNPFEISKPEYRWFPADESLEENRANLIPPLVEKLRKEVEKFRASNYEGATHTSKSLLNWWFNNTHFISNQDLKKI